VAIILATCYEEKRDFKKAVEILTKLKGTVSDSDFLQLKIKRLKERWALLPGARGLKR